VPALPGEFVIASVVISVVDGDTVDVVDGSGGGRVRVRVLGIDTPETKDPRRPVQCWGPEASAFAERVLLGQRVSLYTDPTQSTRDRYGRLLAYIVLPDGHTNYSVAAAQAAPLLLRKDNDSDASRSRLSTQEPKARTAGGPVGEDLTTLPTQTRVAAHTFYRASVEWMREWGYEL